MINEKYINLFLEFTKIKQDKFLNYILEIFPYSIERVGKHLSLKSPRILFVDNTMMEEFFDFIDGYNFIIERGSIIRGIKVIEVIPIYGGEDEEEKESAISMELSIQNTILSYASMEDDKRYILEYKKFLASWSFWLRICRRMELLRLVPKGRCGSAAVPRPP